MKAKNVQSIIFLVFFSLFANQAWAADWIYFDTAQLGDVYYDKSSIKKVSENIISVWNKDVLSEKAKKKYFSLLKGIHKAPDNPSMLSYYTKLMEIDCVNKKIKDISVTIYDEKDNVIYSSPKSESREWNAILPKTVGEKLINIVSCEPATPNESVVATKIDEPVTSKKVVVAHSHRSTAYSGYVESFKSEDKAVIFVNKMKAKGFVAFYLKEDVPGKGKFYRAYVDR